MTDLSWLVPLPVVIPLFSAGLTLALYRRPRVQPIVSVSALTLVLLAPSRCSSSPTTVRWWSTWATGPHRSGSTSSRTGSRR